jgi:hypothetical protein
MNTHNRSRYDMLIRVRNFSATHGQLFPENSTAHTAFSALATEVAQIEALAVAEHVASQSARATRKLDARKQLVDILVRAANTARVLSRTIPGLAAYSDVPAAAGDGQLLTSARAFTSAVTPHVAQFAAHGITIERLSELIDAFETAMNERGVRRNELAQTRDRLDTSLKRALEAVETLDVTITNTLANDPVTLAAWKRERRLQLRRRHAATAVRPTVRSRPADAPMAPPASIAPSVSAESVGPETPVVTDDATTTPVKDAA